MAGSLRTRAYDEKNAGAISIAESEIIFSAAAARQLIASLPAGAVILRTWVEILTAFNAGSSNLVTVGYGAVADATADDYVATVTEGTPGVYDGVAAGVPLAALAAAQDVYAYYTPGGTAPTTGKARAFVMWARLAANGQ